MNLSSCLVTLKKSVEVQIPHRSSVSAEHWEKKICAHLNLLV